VRTTEEAESVVNLLRTGLSEDLLQQYVAKLQNELGVSINEAAFRNATGATQN
jgi:peptidyl-prolyl cis-trans isomerase D